MAKVKDRTEDFKDAVHASAVSSGYTESKLAALMTSFIMHKHAKRLPFTKAAIKTVLILSERLHSVTTQFDQLRSVRFQDAINRAMPRRKRHKAPSKSPEVELTNLLDAVQETETKMVEMSALNHLMSTHVLQQAQQIELLYNQAVEATKNVELGNRELTQAIQRNSGSRTFLILFLLVLTFSVIFLDWYN
ncbi:hypothetical protein HPP92_027856 [Vanilla planifolia]|uniref:Uncharacterized protein n=1 Tax=Vanilla planifolia TaxID=51239 RepID=A0A835P9H2_VANPL|nr:hypothetical protein HPP92_027856 [Vanilla planifolia]